MRFLCNNHCDSLVYNNCDMNDLAKRVKDCRLEKGWSQKDLATRSGVSQTTIADIERRRNKGTARITDIAKALGVDAQYLYSGTVNRVEDVKSTYNVQPGPDIRGKVPLISWTMAGNWSEAADLFHPGDAEEWVDTTSQVREHTYALRVEGDSMEPDFPAGTILIVEPQMEPIVGDYVIVKNGGDSTFKQLVRDGADFYLKPLNSRYPIKPLPDDAVICGVVRESVRKFR